MNYGEFQMTKGGVNGCATDLLGSRLAEWEHPGGKHVFSSVIDGTRRKDFWSNLGLQASDQLHVEPQGEHPFGWQDDYRIPRLVNGDHEIKLQIRTNCEKEGKGELERGKVKEDSCRSSPS